MNRKPTMRTGLTIYGILLAATLSLAPQASAQEKSEPRLASQIVNDISIDQKLNSQVPLDVPFRDEAGRDVKLGDYFGKRPVILTLAYNRCTMLCTQVLNGLVNSLKILDFTPGKEFELVTVSIDPSETPEEARGKKESYVKFYGRPEAADSWHFLTGNESSIRQVAEAVGFRYIYDSVSKQFAHASGIMVITPDGRVAAYQYGIEYSPKDLRLSLVDASSGKIGSPVDQLILLCYHYDPLTGKYGFAVSAALKIGATLTILALGAFLAMSIRRDRRKRKQIADLAQLHSGMNN